MCWSASVCLICRVQSWSASKDRTQAAKWSAGLRIQITLFTDLRCLKHTGLGRIWGAFLHQQFKLRPSGTRRPGASSSPNLLGTIYVCLPFPSLCLQRQKSANTDGCKRCVHDKQNTSGVGEIVISVRPPKAPQVANVSLQNKILTQQKEVARSQIIAEPSSCLYRATRKSAMPWGCKAERAKWAHHHMWVCREVFVHMNKHLSPCSGFAGACACTRICAHLS